MWAVAFLALAAGPLPAERDLWLIARLGSDDLRHPLAERALLSPNGKLLASVSRDRTLLWDVATGKLRRRLYTGRLWSAHWTPGGFLAGIRDDGKAALAIDPNSGKASRMPLTRQAGPVAVYRDNLTVLSIGRDRAALVDAKTGKSTPLKGHRLEGSSIPLALSPDGKFLAFFRPYVGAFLVDLANPKKADKLFHASHVHSLQVTAGGRFVLALGDNGKYWLHDVRADRTRHETAQVLITTASVSEDGKSLAAISYHGAVLVLDAATGKVRLGPDGHWLSVAGAAFAPSGDVFTASEDGRVLRWPRAEGWEVKHDAPGQCRSLRLSADGRFMTVATIYGGVLVYSGAGLKQKRRLVLPDPVARSAGAVMGGRRLLAATEEGKVCLLDLAARDPLVRTLGPGFRSISGYTNPFSASGRYAAFSWGHDLNVFDVRAAKHRWLPGRPGEYVIKAAAFSPDDRLLAVSREDGELLFRAPATLRILARLPAGTARPTCLEFSDDGRLLFEGLWDPKGVPRVRVWDVATRGLWKDVPSEVGGVVVLCTRGRRLVVGGIDGRAIVWEVEPSLPARRPPKPTDVAKWWRELGSADPRISRLAARRLAARPDVALPLIADRFRIPRDEAGERHFDKALLALERMNVPAARGVVERLLKKAPDRPDLKAALARMRSDHATDP
jgi:WD40 repeat protein